MSFAKRNSRRSKQPEAADDESRIRSVALALQSYREHGAKELETKLTRKGYDAPTTAQVIADLRESGLVSDHRFTAAFVRGHAARGHGPIRIRYDLRELGVAAELIEFSLASKPATSGDADVLSREWPPSDELARGELGADRESFDWSRLAGDVRRRKFGERAPSSFAERAKQMRFLQYRGFSTDQIRAAFATFGNKAQEIDELPDLDPDE